MKRRNVAQPWTCVHGGTSATLVALLEGRTLFTANVGDSSALVGMQGRRLVVSTTIKAWNYSHARVRVQYSARFDCVSGAASAGCVEWFPSEQLYRLIRVAGIIDDYHVVTV